MRKIIAFFITILIVIPFLFAFLVIAPVRTWALDRNMYYDIFSGERLNFLLQMQSLPINIGGPIIPSQGLTDAFYAAFKTTITPQYLQTQAKGFIDTSLDFIEGASSTLEYKVDLKPLKQSILGEKQTEFINTLEANIPICDAAQAQMMQQMAIFLCRPADMSASDFTTKILTPSLPTLVDYIPDEYSLNTIPMAWLQNALNLIKIIPGMNFSATLTLAVALLGVMAIAFWLLAALISGSRWKYRLLWLGWSLILPTITVLGIGILLQTSYTMTWATNWLNGINATFLTPELQSGILNIGEYTITKIGQPFLIAGGLGCALGLVLLVWGIVLKPKSDDVSQPA